MKKCPFCKADIEENARFCLYCMKSLGQKTVIQPTQKKKHWLLLTVICMLLALLVVILFFSRGETDISAALGSSFTTNTTSSQSTAGTEETMQDTQNDTTTDAAVEQLQPIPDTTHANQTQDQQPEVIPPESGHNDETPTPSESPELIPAPSTQPDESRPTTPQPTVPEANNQPTTPVIVPEEPTVPTPTEDTTPLTTNPEPQPQTVVYNYRAANAGDDHTGLSVDPASDIVITGVKTPAADGVYHIPSYIDGKRVIAIGNIAFTSLDVREVVLGETIRNVHQQAFVGCYNIGKFYVCSNTLYISRSTFTDAYRRNCALTFYCSAQCIDQISGGTLKDAIVNFGASYEEWNG